MFGLSKVVLDFLQTSPIPTRYEMLTRGRPLRLAYFVSHPIQYQAPLLRRIAKEPDIELEVFFSVIARERLCRLGLRVSRWSGRSTARRLFFPVFPRAGSHEQGAGPRRPPNQGASGRWSGAIRRRTGVTATARRTACG